MCARIYFVILILNFKDETQSALYKESVRAAL